MEFTAVYLQDKKYSEKSFEDLDEAIIWLNESEDDVQQNFIALAVINEAGQRVWPPKGEVATIDYIEIHYTEKIYPSGKGES